MLEVWGRRSSSNVQALMWCIGELRLDYVRHDIGHRHGGTDTPAFLAMNPNGKIPVIKDNGGEPLWETGAILRYLAGCYGTDSFWPPDTITRAHIDKWAEWSKLNIALAFTGPVFWRVVRTARAEHDTTAIAAALTRLNHDLDIAETQLSRNAYIAGEVFTLADIQFGHVLFRYFDISIERNERPHLSRYYEALTTRTAFRDHVMVPYEELRVTGQP